MAYQGMPYLKNKLAMKQGRVNLRYNYYEMKTGFRTSTLLSRRTGHG